MTTISGLPAHALLIHAIVVLAPLTALLEMLCAVWSAARRRFVWLVLALAAVNMALTPLTIEAGEWLYSQEDNPQPILQTHAERGPWMLYISIALLVVAIALTVLHWSQTRSDKPRALAAVLVAVLAIAVGAASIVGVFLIGDAGARAVWDRSD